MKRCKSITIFFRFLITFKCLNLLQKKKEIFYFRDLLMAAQNLVKSTCFKLRRLRPCLISSLQVWINNMRGCEMLKYTSIYRPLLDEEGTIHFCLSGTTIYLSIYLSLYIVGSMAGWRGNNPFLFIWNCHQAFTTQTTSGIYISYAFLKKMHLVFTSFTNSKKMSMLSRHFYGFGDFQIDGL